MGNSRAKLLPETLPQSPCETLFWDTLTIHACGALVGHSCRTLFRGTLVPHTCAFSRTHASSLQNERFIRDFLAFARDFLQKSDVKSPEQTLRARVFSKLMRQVSKTSVLYEGTSKIDTSSLQNERLVRDFLHKFRARYPLRSTRRSLQKRALRTRLPSKVKQEDPSEPTHQAAPAKHFRSPTHSKPQPPTHPSQCHNDIHRRPTSQPHGSLRLPRKFNFDAQSPAARQKVSA